MAKVFISYQRRPSAILATYLHEKLKHYGIDVYLDTRQVDSGGHFPDRLVGAIEASDVFVCLVADTTFESDWVRREIEHAYNLSKTMIPIFQESYEQPRQMPDRFVESLLQSDGIQILDTKNIYIDESVEQLAHMILRTAPRKSSPLRLFAVIGIMLLILVAAGGALLFSQSATTPTPIPVLAPSAPPTPISTSTNAPTLAPTPGCPFALPVRLTAGGLARVRTDDPRQMNVRLGPSTDYRLAGQIEPGEVFSVLEGPLCAESYAWYRVQYGEIEGWIAEGDTNYFVEPYTPAVGSLTPTSGA